MAQSEGQNNQLTGSMTGVLNPSVGPQALQSPPSAHHSQSLDRELKMLAVNQCNETAFAHFE